MPSPVPPAPSTAPGADVGTASRSATLDAPRPDPQRDTDTTLWAVVFAGGIGTRFWPLATPRRPKQVLPLVNERPLIADTIARLAPAVPADRVLVVTSADIADAIRQAIPEVPAANHLVEPRPLGTAAALAWGATEVARRAGPDAVFVALHADLAVAFPDSFRQTLHRGAALAARHPILVAIGARPTRSETAFGYLLPGAPLDPDEGIADGGPCRVDHMVEKPRIALADTLIDQGALWYTGMCCLRARVALDELAANTPELRQALPALQAGDVVRYADLGTTVSIERGLLERTEQLVVLPGDFGWDDVGTWAALRRIRDLDDTGNGVMGPVHCVDASGNVVHADGGRVVVYGITGMLVVAMPGLTFVTSLDKATELGPLLNRLPGSLRFNPGQE
jgi:mannose-1-phosphate guanylyltransferase